MEVQARKGEELGRNESGGEQAAAAHEHARRSCTDIVSRVRALWAMEVETARRPGAPVTTLLPQADEGSATMTTTTGEREEQRWRTKADERIECGRVAVVFGFSTLTACFCSPNDAQLENNVAFIVCLFLAFKTLLSGLALLPLSFDMRGRRADQVSHGQCAAAKCLSVACTVLSPLTLLSLVALLPSRLYQYISLAAVAVVLLLTAWAHWYLRHRRGGRGGAQNNDEHDEELKDASKLNTNITYSACGGLVLVLFNSPKISGGAAADSAVYVAIFLMLATAVLGVLVTSVAKKVAGITEPRLQRLYITMTRQTNVLLLCSLACAALAAASVVLRYLVFAAFVPLGITGAVTFLLRHRMANGQVGENEEQLKKIEDLASKVTFGGIMGVLAGSVGQKYNSQRTGVRGTFLVVVTSAFVSGLGIMVLAAAPGSARAFLEPATKVLLLFSVAFIAVTAVAVYGVEVWTM